MVLRLSHVSRDSAGNRHRLSNLDVIAAFSIQHRLDQRGRGGDQLDHLLVRRATTLISTRPLSGSNRSTSIAVHAGNGART